VAILVSSFAVAVTVRAMAQTTRVAEDGRELFSTYCADCHGVTGKGDGPVASLLRQRPSDLTTITLQSRGIFPAVRLHRIIDGRDMVAHGDPEMPVWGNAFMASSEPAGEDAVRARIDAIVAFLETIQTHRRE
jgi:mono/diheme cytochrome c family protein